MFTKYPFFLKFLSNTGMIINILSAVTMRDAEYMFMDFIRKINA